MACRGGGSNPPPDSRGRPSFDFLVRSEFYARTDTIDRLVAVQRKDDPLVAPIGRRLVAQDIGAADVEDRKSVVSGKSVSVRVDLGGRRIMKKKRIAEQYIIRERMRI